MDEAQKEKAVEGLLNDYNSEIVTLYNADEAVEFLETLHGYGVIFQDENILRDFLEIHYGLE